MNIIIDYKSGNIRSLANALDRLGAEYVVSSNAKEIVAADRILFPGQGNIAQVMESLKELGLIDVIMETQQPFLGICVGMQILYEKSDEGCTKGLEIIKGKVERFSEKYDLKVPQMGWNTVKFQDNTPLFSDIPNESFFYYANSYSASLTKNTIAQSEYGKAFTAICQHKNFYGVQFHPEKSGTAGLQLLKNFLSLT